jgi:hypothetical protein
MRIFFLAICLSSCLFTEVVWGQLTATQKLIHDEIFRLGGDFETGESPALVQFIGPKFKVSDFEMLTHLPTTQTFYAKRCKLNKFSIECVSKIEGLVELGIVECEVDGDCFSSLRENKKLRSLILDDVKISKRMMVEIAQLDQLNELVLDYSVVPANFKSELVKMKSLKKCHATACGDITDKDVEELKEAFSEVDFTVTEVSMAEIEARRTKDVNQAKKKQDSVSK